MPNCVQYNSIQQHTYLYETAKQLGAELSTTHQNCIKILYTSVHKNIQHYQLLDVQSIYTVVQLMMSIQTRTCYAQTPNTYILPY